MNLDRERLLAFLTSRADHRTPLVAAIYAGLAERVRRGEFDQKEGGDPCPGAKSMTASTRT